MVFDCWTAVLHRGAAVVFLWGGVVITQNSKCRITRDKLSFPPLGSVKSVNTLCSRSVASVQNYELVLE